MSEILDLLTKLWRLMKYLSSQYLIVRKRFYVGSADCHSMFPTRKILQRLVDILLAAVRAMILVLRRRLRRGPGKNFLHFADDPAMPTELRCKTIAAAKKVGA